jgi:hypothetical protein
MAHEVEDELPIEGLRLMRAFFRLRTREQRFALVAMAAKMANIQAGLANLSIVTPAGCENERKPG